MEKIKVKLEQKKQDLLKIKKEKDTLIYLFFLSKMYINDSSKELINNIKQLINKLYDNKQIIKQLHNILNKTITYSKRIYK